MRTSALFALVLAACGGSGEGGGLSTDAITAEEAQPLCEANCQHAAACGDTEGVPACTATCVDEVDGWARGDAVEEIFECLNALSCDASDDACQAVVEPLSIHRDFEAECMTTMAACFPEPGELEETCRVTPAEGDAGFWRFIAPVIMEELIACFDQVGCDPILDCWTVIVETHGIDL